MCNKFGVFSSETPASLTFVIQWDKFNLTANIYIYLRVCILSVTQAALTF